MNFWKEVNSPVNFWKEVNFVGEFLGGRDELIVKVRISDSDIMITIVIARIISTGIVTEGAAPSGQTGA